MIALVRVDNRLVHGQILEAWVPRLGAKRIVVADDDAAASTLAKAAMMLPLPPDLAGAVLPVERIDYAALASTPERVLLLFRDVEAVTRAWRAGLTPRMAPRVNLGNVHYTSGRCAVTPSVFLSADEVRQVEELSAAGFQVDACAVPSDSLAGPREMRDRFEANALKR